MGHEMNNVSRSASESHSSTGAGEEVGRSRRHPLAWMEDLDPSRRTTGRIPGCMREGGGGGGGAALAVACALFVLPAAAGPSQLCFAGPGSGLARGLEIGAMRMPVLSLRHDSSSSSSIRSSSCSGRGAACVSILCGAAMSEAGDKVFNSRRIARWADGLLKEDAKLLGSRRVARGISSIMGRRKERMSSDKLDGDVRAGRGLKTDVAREESDEIVGSAAEAAAEAVAAMGQVPSAAVAVGSSGVPSSFWSSTSAATKVASATATRREDEEQSEVGEEEEEEWGGIFASGAPPARPSNIPELTAKDEELLLAGERVQRQTRDGRVGQGMVVVDVKADASTVFAVLTDIERYTERISTVRRCNIYERGPKTAKATFALSRFMLTVNTVLRCERDANILRFEIDEERPTPIMEEAKGQWFLEMAPGRDNDDGVWTRVWLTSSIKCSPLLPTFLIDYAASRALPRATRWLKPTIEAIADQLPEGAGNVREAYIATLDEASE